MANNRTLPILVGEVEVYKLLTVINLAWAAAVVGFFMFHVLNWAHCLFLVGLSLFPFAYMYLYNRKHVERWQVEFLSETDLLFFAGGLAALTVL